MHSNSGFLRPTKHKDHLFINNNKKKNTKLLFFAFNVRDLTKRVFPSPKAYQKATNQKLQHSPAQRTAISSKLLFRSTFVIISAIFIKIIKKNQYPTKNQMENICRKLGKSMEKIRNWFKHQRKREVVQGKRKFNVIEKKNL